MTALLVIVTGTLVRLVLPVALLMLAGTLLQRAQASPKGR